MQTDFEAMGGMVDFQFLRIFPLKNRCIVFITGKNTPTETKTLSSESVVFRRKQKGEN